MSRAPHSEREFSPFWEWGTNPHTITCADDSLKPSAFAHFFFKDLEAPSGYGVSPGSTEPVVYAFLHDPSQLHMCTCGN
jgi:hypothetical protein